jgi:hypothetical protein
VAGPIRHQHDELPPVLMRIGRSLRRGANVPDVGALRTVTWRIQRDSPLFCWYEESSCFPKLPPSPSGGYETENGG